MQNGTCTSIKLILLVILISLMLLLAACSTPETLTSTPEPTQKPTQTSAIVTQTATLALPKPSLTPSSTFGPSPTSTVLPPLGPRQWETNSTIVEFARVSADPLDFFSYTPLLMVYSDGRLIKRICQEYVCQYQQSQLDQTDLCQLINAIDRTGFLDAGSNAFQLPPGTDVAYRLSVAVNQENTVTVPDLARWIETPNWYDAVAGCSNCYPDPIIDPALIDLYELLISYNPPDLTSYQSTRLAISITDPVIAGTPRPWPEEVIPFSELLEESTCDAASTQRQAVILEGALAQAIAEVLSAQSALAPIFSDGEETWQVQSNWLLPNELPQTCQSPAGIYPNNNDPLTSWRCSPEMGAIPTSTATITPTPSITPTPLR